jgi:hypothetical protein
MKSFLNLKFLSLSLFLLDMHAAEAEFCVGGSCDTCNCIFEGIGTPVKCDSSTSVMGCCGGEATTNCQTYCCSSTKCKNDLQGYGLPLNTPILGVCTGTTCGNGTAKACWTAASDQLNEKMQNKQEAPKKLK